MRLQFIAEQVMQSRELREPREQTQSEKIKNKSTYYYETQKIIKTKQKTVKKKDIFFSRQFIMKSISIGTLFRHINKNNRDGFFLKVGSTLQETLQSRTNFLEFSNFVQSASVFLLANLLSYSTENIN